MTPFARLRTPDGRVVAVSPGGLIGRVATAALRLDDPRISEAHAMLSLRNRRLCLVTLRGSVQVGGLPADTVELQAGMEIRLAADLSVVVEEIVVPDSVLALELEARLTPLSGEVWSVLAGHPPEVVPRLVPRAQAWIWSSGSDWRVSVTGGRPRSFEDGVVVDVGGLRLCARTVSIEALESTPTKSRGRLHPPLAIRITLSEARITPEGRPTLIVTGHGAQILSELADYQEPVRWTLVANTIWPTEDDEGRLRINWDRNLRLLRSRLREHGVRDDLVSPDGHGNVSLRLFPGDTLENQG